MKFYICFSEKDAAACEILLQDPGCTQIDKWIATRYLVLADVMFDRPKYAWKEDQRAQRIMTAEAKPESNQSKFEHSAAMRPGRPVFSVNGKLNPTNQKDAWRYALRRLFFVVALADPSSILTCADSVKRRSRRGAETCDQHRVHPPATYIQRETQKSLDF